MATENKYYLRNMNNEIICIVHGETGYYLVENQDADDDVIRATNRMNHNSEASVDAAETCSMFDCWDKFDEISDKMEKALANKDN